MNKICHIASILVLSLMVSCNHKQIVSSENYMIFDEVVYATQFPINVTLADAEDTGFDIIGINNFQLLDSMLFISSRDRDGFWQFFSMNDKRLKGKILSMGQGPNEFFFPVSDGNVFSFENNTESLYGYIFDNQHGYVYQIDVDASLSEGEIVMSILSKDLPNSVVSCKVIDGHTYLCREIVEGAKRQVRYVLNDGKKLVPEVLEKLNRAMVADISNGLDHNIISSMIQRQGDRFLESMPYLNYVNIYSLDGKLGKTICMDEKLLDINSVQALPDGLRNYVSISERAFERFFGVATYNHTWMEWELGTFRGSQIKLFDWEGQPLAVINLDRFVSAFDIDFKRGELYVLSLREDEFVKYDINELLHQLGV